MEDAKSGRTGGTGFSGEVRTPPGVSFGKEVEVIEVEGDRAKVIWYRVGTKVVRMKVGLADILVGEGKE
jgi:hypothetical protein